MYVFIYFAIKKMLKTQIKNENVRDYMRKLLNIREATYLQIEDGRDGLKKDPKRLIFHQGFPYRYQRKEKPNCQKLIKK